MISSTSHQSWIFYSPLAVQASLLKDDLLDPVDPLLDDPELPRLLTAGGLLVLGHARRDTLTVPASWHEMKMLKHGDSMMRFLEAGFVD